jgi:hypothetical protein
MNNEKKILFAAVVEMLGRPKEHLQEMLKKVIEDLKTRAEFEVVKEFYEEPEQHETMFSSYVELEVRVADAQHIAWFCFDFLPASIEIIEPEDVTFKSQELSSFFNELTTRMHIVDKEMKKLKQENFILNKNGKQIVKNSITVCLAKQEMVIQDITHFTGVPEKLLKELADELIKEGIVEKSGDIFRLK